MNNIIWSYSRVLALLLAIPFCLILPCVSVVLLALQSRFGPPKLPLRPRAFSPRSATSRPQPRDHSLCRPGHGDNSPPPRFRSLIAPRHIAAPSKCITGRSWAALGLRDEEKSAIAHSTPRKAALMRNSRFRRDCFPFHLSGLNAHLVQGWVAIPV
jgi:hypothetical protein